ncbi:MAG: hypothetical protein C7B45_04095 [Sulfobacillus acidophilus]|uniref:Uncharacterized protein n=1 Tax=Sulfobacillus acidophilus TaxID=53633 RepID=A0A2T2WLL5_9FIRM|nr:MAG: hypothetical protein C7B45_04095 [Sulfobacillus acidophilus]
MLWEEYLEAAVNGVADKYQARRYKAHFRAQLLEGYDRFRQMGLSESAAMAEAMASLGSPFQLAQRVCGPVTRQRGWLWLLSVIQFLMGISIVAFSLRTQSFAALALGRIMTLWGGVAAGLETRRLGRLQLRWRLLQFRLGQARRTLRLRELERMLGVGFMTGLFLALVSSLPWNIVNANMFHPVFVSMSSSLVLSAVVAGWPWLMLRKWIGASFYLVTFQAWAALCAALSATLLILWHQGFAPPPLFNWQPEMLALGGWIFNFALLRFISVLVTFKERVLVGLDDEPSTLS